MWRIAFCLALSIGCAHARGSWELRAALERAQVELACPQSHLSGEFVGGGAVIVQGCGLRRSYTCLHRLCQPDGPATGQHVALADWTGAEHRITSEQTLALEAIRSCTIAPGTHLSFFIGIEGDVLRVDTPDDPPGARACVEESLRSTRFAPRDDADRVEIAIASPITQGPDIVPPSPTLQVTSTRETAVRAMIDARRESIVLCNGGAPTAVIGEWSVDGSVTIRLPDARIGTPEDGCVRATAQGLRIDPAPGAAGAVLHAVQ